MTPYLLPAALIAMGIVSMIGAGYLAFGSMMLRSEYLSDPQGSRVLAVISVLLFGVSLFSLVGAGKVLP